MGKRFHHAGIILRDECIAVPLRLLAKNYLLSAYYSLGLDLLGHDALSKQQK
jgi:hypothetical protein